MENSINGLNAKVIVKGKCVICGKTIDIDSIMFCSGCKEKYEMSRQFDDVNQTERSGDEK